jgi:hypothetical protein
MVDNVINFNLELALKFIGDGFYNYDDLGDDYDYFTHRFE